MPHSKISEVQERNLTQTIINQFIEIVGPDHILMDTAGMEDYGHDKTEDYFFMPDVVLKPGTAMKSVR